MFAHIDEETDELLKRSRIIENDIVFTIAGTLGKFALVDSSVLPANTNQAVAIIRTSKISPEMLYSYFIGEWQVEFYKKNTQQAVQRLLQILCKPPERCRIETTEQEVKLCQSTN